MFYAVILLILALVIYFVLESAERDSLKQYGITVVGIIIENEERGADSMYRLGGNVNYPTIQFKTVEGKKVIGQPMLGFTSQHEVVVPSYISIIYDPESPYKFMVVGK
jgi:hypothetical protein